ncbi:MAG: hypothetical protein ACKVP0_00685 [Pirellulaceae bacterium]
MRFTLRQLFGAVTFAAVAIVILLYATKSYRERLAIRSHLESIGAYHVRFGPSNSITAAFHNPISSPTIAQYKQISVLDFKEAHVTSASLANLAGLEHVGTILLTMCDVTDEDLLPLQKIGGVRILCLRHTRITDAAIDTIAAIPGLERVDLSHTLVTPTGIERLHAARPSINTEPLWP